MTRHDLVAVLVAQRAVVVILATVILAATAAASLLLPTAYASRAVVIVDAADPDLNLRTPYYSGRLVRDDHNPYADYFVALAGRNAALFPGAGRSDDELLSTTVVGTRSITIEVVGRSSDAIRSAATANAAAESFVETVSGMAASANDRSVRGQTRARFEERAQPPAVPSSPNAALVAVVGVIAAGVVSVAGGLAAHRWSSRGELIPGRAPRPREARAGARS